MKSLALSRTTVFHLWLRVFYLRKSGDLWMSVNQIIIRFIGIGLQQFIVFKIFKITAKIPTQLWRQKHEVDVNIRVVPSWMNENHTLKALKIQQTDSDGEQTSGWLTLRRQELQLFNSQICPLTSSFLTSANWAVIGTSTETDQNTRVLTPKTSSLCVSNSWRHERHFSVDQEECKSGLSSSAGTCMWDWIPVEYWPHSHCSRSSKTCDPNVLFPECPQHRLSPVVWIITNGDRSSGSPSKLWR